MTTARPDDGSSRSTPIGVLWTNLGTPAAPRTPEVRRYLRQFLTDRRVVDVNPIAWRLLLELAILPRRASKSAHAYAQVWTDGGSPLLAYARAQAAGLERELGAGFRVRTAMRYGEPSIRAAIEELLDAGCERLCLLPAFPQYASATTGSAVEEFFRVLGKRRVIPPVVVVPPYPDDRGYIDALGEVAEVATAGRAIDHWVFSFHGIPVRYATAGDPYPEHCARTARALAHRLGLSAERWTLTWQSRFGREPWLEPATDLWFVERARSLGTAALVTPGFTSDCLETIEEIGLRLRDDVRAAGGADFVRVPALNGAPTFLRGLADLVRHTVPPPDGLVRQAGGPA